MAKSRHKYCVLVSSARVLILGEMFFITSIFFVPPGNHQNDYEHKLINDLFNGYSKEALPVMNKSEAIEIMFDLAYSQLIYLVSNLRKIGVDMARAVICYKPCA